MLSVSVVPCSYMAVFHQSELGVIVLWPRKCYSGLNHLGSSLHGSFLNHLWLLQTLPRWSKGYDMRSYRQSTKLPMLRCLTPCFQGEPVPQSWAPWALGFKSACVSASHSTPPTAFQHLRSTLIFCLLHIVLGVYAFLKFNLLSFVERC
jgi:hypothetical protein